MNDPRFTSLAAALGVLALAALLRVVNLGSEWLWYDELLSVTYARAPLGQLLDPRLPDPHPPLYYLQLRYWLALGHSDAWIVSNAVVWSVGSVGSLLLAARRIYGAGVALTGAALLAVSPLSLMFAHETRMYSMMMFFMVWAWYFNHRYMSGESTGPAAVAGIIGSEVCVMLSHAAGPFAASFVSVYALLLARREGAVRSRLLRWAAIQLAVAAAMLPALPYFSKGQGLLRLGDFAYLVAPGPEEVLHTLSEIFFGPTLSAGPWLDVATAAVSALLLVGALRDASCRPLVVALVLAPVLGAVSISHLGPPVWHTRTLSFTCPFVALSMARAAWGSAWRIGGLRGPASSVPRILAAALVAGQLVASIALLQRHPIKGMDPKRATAELRQLLQPGDVVYVPHPFDYWCFAWYFFGPKGETSLSPSGVSRSDGHTVVHGAPRPRIFRDRTVWLWRVSWRPMPPVERHERTDTLSHWGFLVDRFAPTGE